MDREWGIFDVQKKELIANHNTTELLQFTLEFDDADTLIVSHPESAEDLVIDITKHPQNRPGAHKMELYNTKYGYPESEETNRWFSTVLGRPVILVRHPYDVLHRPRTQMVPYARPQDRSEGFCYNSSILLLNESSLKDLINVMRH